MCPRQINWLTHVAVFSQVVESHSFTSAADRLGLSKPTISKHIAALEEHLGMRLLSRTTRSLNLTEAGAKFYQHCREIMVELEAAETEVLGLSSVPRGHLRVIAPTWFADCVLVRILGDFLECYSEIEVDLSLSEHPVDLIAGSFDVAILISRAEPSGLGFTTLAPCVRVVCGSPQYCEQYGMPSVPQDLVHHNCLDCADFRTRDCWQVEGPNGCQAVKVSGRFRINSCAAIRTALLSGLGLGLMPIFLVSEDLRANRLRDVLPGYYAKTNFIFAAYPHGMPIAPKVQAFVDYLEEQADLGLSPY